MKKTHCALLKAPVGMTVGRFEVRHAISIFSRNTQVREFDLLGRASWKEPGALVLMWVALPHLECPHYHLSDMGPASMTNSGASLE